MPWPGIEPCCMLLQRTQPPLLPQKHLKGLQITRGNPNGRRMLLLSMSMPECVPFIINVIHIVKSEAQTTATAAHHGSRVTIIQSKLWFRKHFCLCTSILRLLLPPENFSSPPTAFTSFLSLRGASTVASSCIRHPLPHIIFVNFTRAIKTADCSSQFLIP